ncbi:MAG: hypothetical protein ACKPHU_35075, partial [Planctomycetaceae bacterium]
MQLVFSEGTFTDSAGNANVTTSIPLRVDGATAHPVFPAHSTPSSVELLNNQQWFEIQFKPASGNTIDAATILDAANEFSISGAGRGTAAVTSVEQVGPDKFRYHFSGEFKVGSVTLTFPTGAFKDSEGLSNVATTRSWQLAQLTGTLVDPQPGERVSASELAARNSIDVKL